MQRIGFIGVGTMGGPMARNLLNAGYPLRVFDINPQACAALAADAAKAVTSPADAADDAEIVITMLPNGEDVETAMFGPAGAMESMQQGSLLIEMSTIAPAVTDRIAGKLKTRGIAMLDAPVGRSSQHAVEGKLLIMVGGAAADLERARPVLGKMGDTIVHCGSSGSGSRMKVVNNFMSITANVTTAEALLLAEASGLDPELARKVMLGTTAGQGHMATTYPAKVLRNDVSPGFMVDLAHKDLGLALELASQLDVATPTAAAARPIYERARNEGRGRDDWTSVYAMLRERWRQKT
jgi:4-hydroxybutyrate dehydrogenase/sulfolactaldehyde 3-reductase